MTKNELIAEVKEIRALFRNVTEKEIFAIQAVLREKELDGRHEYWHKANKLNIIWNHRTESGMRKMTKKQLSEYIEELIADLGEANDLMREGLSML